MGVESSLYLFVRMCLCIYVSMCLRRCYMVILGVEGVGLGGGVVWFPGWGFYWSGLCMDRTGLFTEVCGHKRHISKSAFWFYFN